VEWTEKEGIWLVERDFKEMFCLVSKLCDRSANLSDVLASLKIEFLGEIVDSLLEVHIERQSTKQY